MVTSCRNGYVSTVCITQKTIALYSLFLGFTSCGFPHYNLENILHININIKVIIHSSGSFWNSQKIIYHIGVWKKNQLIVSLMIERHLWDLNKWLMILNGVNEKSRKKTDIRIYCV